MTMETGQQAPVDSGAGAPPPDPDAAKYAELAKELDVGQEPESEPEPAAEPTAESSEPVAEPAPQAKPTELDNLKNALKEEREARKAEQARTDAILAALREAKERRGQAEPKKEPEQPQIPDVQADPIGHYNARLAQIEAALQRSHQGGQQQTEQIRVHLQEQAMWGAMQASEVEVRDPKNPDHKADYDDAVNHLMAARAKQLDQFYPDALPQVQALAQQNGFASPLEYKKSLIQTDARGIIQSALQLGVSPATHVYQIALANGYTPKPNGKAAPAASLVERAQQQIAAAKKGTKASLTLSGDSGGRRGATDMSIDDLSELFLTDPELADKTMEQMQRAGKLG